MIDKRDEALIRKIIQYCEEIDLTLQRFGKTKHIFQNDLVYRNACALCILQIGELANHVSAKLRENATYIPWKQVRGMRNVVAHAYGTIDVEVLWEAILEDIPPLKNDCLQLLQDSEQQKL